MEKDLEKKYKKIIKIHQGVDSEVWIVNKNGVKYIEKIIYKTNLILKKIKDIKTNNIPRIIYMIEDIDNNKTYIIEEFIEGNTLSEYINKKISEYEVKKIMLSLCDALDAIHNEEIVHQDIKPANIMYTSKKEIKLIDFDAAVDFGPNTNTEHNKNGTEGFAAPEQYIYGKVLDERTDIYSLGITISQLLGSKYKGYLNNIVEKCTEFDPDDRYQNIDELKYAIYNKKKTERRKKIYGRIHYEGFEKWTYCSLYLFSLLTIIGILLILSFMLVKNEFFIRMLIVIYAFIFFNSLYIGKKLLEYVSLIEMRLIYQDYGNDKYIYLIIHFFIAMFGYFGIISVPVKKFLNVDIYGPETFWIIVPMIIASIILALFNCIDKYERIS